MSLEVNDAKIKFLSEKFLLKFYRRALGLVMKILQQHENLCQLSQLARTAKVYFAMTLIMKLIMGEMML